MAEILDVAVLVGSLRRESLTRRLVQSCITIAPAGLRLEIVDIGSLLMYSQDYESAPPDSWTTFRTRIKRADAVWFATPEYNRSVPGCLKNAIDVGSRPSGHSAWKGKPAAVMSVSPGRMGAFGANQHLRQSLVSLDMPTLQQPEAYVSGADKLLDATGAFVTAETRAFCSGFLLAFQSWIRRFVPV